MTWKMFGELFMWKVSAVWRTESQENFSSTSLSEAKKLEKSGESSTEETYEFAYELWSDLQPQPWLSF